MTKEKPITLRKGQKCWECKKVIKGSWCWNGFHWFHSKCKDKDTRRIIKKHLKDL